MLKTSLGHSNIRAKNALNVDWGRCVASIQPRVVNVETGAGKSSSALWFAEKVLTDGEFEPILIGQSDTLRRKASSLLAALRQLTNDTPPVDSQVLPLGESVSDSGMFTLANCELGALANAPKTVEASPTMDAHSPEIEQYGLELREVAQADVAATKLEAIPSYILFRCCASHFDDDRYWREFVRRYSQSLIRSVYQSYRRFSVDDSPSREVVSDIIQEIYLKILKDSCADLLRFCGTSEIDAELYLTHIATSVTIDHIRRQCSLAASESARIRRSLISFFNSRGCADAEGLADETIERVVQLLPKFGKEPPYNLLRYCYGVARYIYKEYLRDEVSRNAGDLSKLPPVAYDRALTEAKEAMDMCLSDSLGKLDEQKRETFIRYYLVNSEEKSGFHQTMAETESPDLIVMELDLSWTP
jgi:DNA-directed RNA polymerase specialized sigma24 family protein